MPLVRSVEVARFTPITAGSRLIALLALAPPVAFTQSYPVILSTMLIAAIWMAATFATTITNLDLMPFIVVESSLVAFCATLPLEYSTLLIPTLVIPQFAAGIHRGTRGAFESLGAEVVVLTAVLAPATAVAPNVEMLAILFTWLLAGLGFGLIGAVVRSAKLELGDTTRSSYRDARALLTQLLELSDDLVGGLDPVSIGHHAVEVAREEIPLSGVLVHARTPDGEVVILEGDDLVHPERAALVEATFESGKASRVNGLVAIPLSTDASVVAVLTGGLAPGVDPDRIELDDALTAVTRMLSPEALKLDTAMMFSAVRESATAEERQRIAREMHDGVAQDLASFGYLIDDASATAESDEQRQHLAELRTELSSVVAEFRRSVFSLRNEAAADRTLGERVAALAEHIRERQGVRIEVHLDEGRARLRPEVETELQRIAQEGLNNAAKHARATLIRVSVDVAAPHARIQVEDDGVGLQRGRSDSHGVRIMRERAARIGADLQLIDTGRGTLLDVTLGSPAAAGITPPPLEGSTST